MLESRIYLLESDGFKVIDVQKECWDLPLGDRLISAIRQFTERSQTYYIQSSAGREIC
jgi:hypothetical protein